MDNSVTGGGFPPGQLFLGRDGKVFGPFGREQIEAMRASGELAQYHWLWDGSGQWVAANLPPPPPAMVPAKEAAAPVSAPSEVFTPVSAMDTPASSSGAFPALADVDEEDTEITENLLVSSGKVEVDLREAGPLPPTPPQFNHPVASKPPASPPGSKGKKAASPPPKPHQKPRAVETKPPVPSVAARELAAIRVVCFDRKRVVNGTLARASADGCVFALRLAVHPTKSTFIPGHPLWLNLIDEATGRSENVRTVLTAGTRSDGKLELKLKWDRLPRLLSGQANALSGS